MIISDPRNQSENTFYTLHALQEIALKIFVWMFHSSLTASWRKRCCLVLADNKLVHLTSRNENSELVWSRKSKILELGLRDKEQGMYLKEYFMMTYHTY